MYPALAAAVCRTCTSISFLEGARKDVFPLFCGFCTLLSKEDHKAPLVFSAAFVVTWPFIRLIVDNEVVLEGCHVHDVVAYPIL